MLDRLNAFLVALVIALVIILAAVSLAPSPPITTEQTAYREYCAQTKKCDSQQTKSLWVPQDSTGFFTLWIALFTSVLAVGTLFLWDATKEVANAAKLSAEAVISAERAHMFVIVVENNVHTAMRGVRFFADDQSANMQDSRIPRLMLEFVIRNTGRTAAILQAVSYRLFQADAEFTDWTYGFEDTIVVPVVEGNSQTTPPTPCVAQSDITIADGAAALAGDRPLFFYGCVTFRDTFERDYQYFWRYEYRAGRFALVHEKEDHPPSIN
jgi:type IV secretory pathway VirB3-like protein